MAFTTRSRFVKDKPARKLKSEQPRNAEALVSPVLAPVAIPVMETVDLCQDQEAHVDDHLQDLVQLLHALETGANDHQGFLASVVAITEERCAAAQRVAVEAATQAAIRTTEMRCAEEKRVAVEEAVLECREAARQAQEAAVGEAIRLTELKLADQHETVVHSALTNLEIARGGLEDDEVLQTEAAAKFEAAAASAGAALAAASNLLRSHELVHSEGEGEKELKYL